ncbi:IclR family transcriptional regulator [Kocuria sp. M1R5S2]|uniref:IclR family transcriptional regulator n=1 Tax=Kocuria rhizosphaerae TaxID=3376285 RepID=UPI0037B58E76
MRNQDQQPPPAYTLHSVDNVLRLMQMLRDTGGVRLKDVAADLGVAPSTAHRLLSMLVYRGFAVQDDSRRYLPGPGLGASVAGTPLHGRLRRIARPYVEMLAQRVGETANLIVRVGTTSRFLVTVESSVVDTVGDRRGTVFPAASTSGGKVLLAQLSREDLERLFRTASAKTVGEYLDANRFEALLRSLQLVKEVGFAVNREESEEGVTAVAVPVLAPDGTGLAALSVSVPAARADVLGEHRVRRALADIRTDLEQDIAEHLG